MCPKISVIIANHNNAEFLSDCLSSVVNQAFRDLECIVIDDGSTDNSREIITDFATRDSRIKTLFIENSGVSAARNAGLDIAGGEWIAFLDSDDCFFPDMLGLLHGAGLANNADIVGAGAFTVRDKFKISYSGGREVLPWQPEFNIYTNSTSDIKSMEKLGRGHRFVWVWRRLFRREVIGDLRFELGMFPGEDTCFILSVLPRTKRIVELNTVAVYHRVHPGNTLNKPFNQAAFAYVAPAIEKVHDIISKNYDNEFKRYFYKNWMDLIMFEVVTRPIVTGRLRRQAAHCVKPFMGRPQLPLGRLPLLKRILFWLFVKWYGK